MRAAVTRRGDLRTDVTKIAASAFAIRGSLRRKYLPCRPTTTGILRRVQFAPSACAKIIAICFGQEKRGGGDRRIDGRRAALATLPQWPPGQPNPDTGEVATGLAICRQKFAF